MKAVAIPSRGFGRGEKCRHCHKALKIGDMGVWQDIVHRDKHKGFRITIWFHRECMQKVVDNSPGSRAAVIKEFEKARGEAEALVEGE